MERNVKALLGVAGWRRQSGRRQHGVLENKREKSETSQELVLFNQVPWNDVDMQLHFDAVKINKEDAESLLSDQNFSDNGSFLIRHDNHKGPNHLLFRWQISIKT